jgi:hypothetical protein
MNFSGWSYRKKVLMLIAAIGVLRAAIAFNVHSVMMNLIIGYTAST